MDKGLKEFIDVARVLEAQAKYFSATSVYSIGLCSTKTDKYPVTYLMDLAKKLSEQVTSGEITEAQRTVGEYLLSEGKVEQVQALLEAHFLLRQKRPREDRRSALDHFTQRVEINGRVFLKNPVTHEVTIGIDPTLILPEETVREQPRPEPTVTLLNCAICMEPIPEADYLPLEKCGCIFHQVCVLTYLTESIENRRFPILCPQNKCKTEVHPLDLRERLPAAVFQRFEQTQFDWFLMRNGKDFQNCPTPGCLFVFTWTKENNRFKCPMCTKVYCLLCRKDFHEGITCQEYKKLTDPQDLEQQFQRAAMGDGYQQCPQCKAWVSKVDGCDHIGCVCGQDFCYSCGLPLDNCTCDGERRDSDEVSDDEFLCPNCLQQNCQCDIPVCRQCLLRIDVCQCY